MGRSSIRSFRARFGLRKPRATACRLRSTIRPPAELRRTASSPERWARVASRFGLGRGLDALIPRPATEAGVLEVPVDRIGRNPHQPRVRFDEAELAELAASIAEHGVIQPIVVRTIIDGAISEGHGRALAAISVPELQRAVLQVVLQRHLSVRQTEELVRRRRAQGPIRTRIPLSSDLQDLETQLRGLLATKVGIARSRRGGRLVIEFYSDEELDRIYTIISRGTGVTPSPGEEPSAQAAIAIDPRPGEVQP